MDIGKKIKIARQKKKLTQAELAGTKITRNMLSAIENGKASPSIDTVKYLAEQLEMPLPYLFSDDDDIFTYKKQSRIRLIKNALEAKSYTVCIHHISKIGGLDDELAFILATCYFHLGIGAVKNGSLDTALGYLKHCEECCAKTLYDTRRFECVLPVYIAICKNPSSPLLELDDKGLDGYITETIDADFCRYVRLDFDYAFTNPQIKAHVEAKKLIKERKYQDARRILSQIEDRKNEYEHNSYVMFCIYADLEICCKYLADFEGAYRYASKRLSLMEGFKS